MEIYLKIFLYFLFLSVFIHVFVIYIDVTKDPITPKVCRYTTLWNVNVRKQQLRTRLL